jgi:translation initiation factor 6 (eIF-6)
MNKQEFSDLQKKFGEETKKRKYQKVFRFFSTLISILGITVISYYFIETLFIKNDIQKLVVENKNIQLQKRINELENRLRKKDTTISISSPNEERIQELEKKIQTLNNIIIENPEKSLTIPLLNKDIQSIKRENDLQIELIKDKVETVVDLNKWILGLIFSLLITIVISNLAKNKPKNNLEE